MNYSRLMFLLLVVALRPCIAQVQTEMNGRWLMTLTPPGQNSMSLDVHAETVSDTLHLALVNHEGALPLTGAALTQNQLRFEIPSGHGLIQCTLHKKDPDTFTGICAGPMGEGATILKRAPKKEG